MVVDETICQTRPVFLVLCCFSYRTLSILSCGSSRLTQSFKIAALYTLKTDHVGYCCHDDCQSDCHLLTFSDPRRRTLYDYPTLHYISNFDPGDTQSTFSIPLKIIIYNQRLEILTHEHEFSISKKESLTSGGVDYPVAKNSSISFHKTNFLPARSPFLRTSLAAWSSPVRQLMYVPCE